MAAPTDSRTPEEIEHSAGLFTLQEAQALSGTHRWTLTMWAQRGYIDIWPTRGPRASYLIPALQVSELMLARREHRAPRFMRAPTLTEARRFQSARRTEKARLNAELAFLARQRNAS